MAVCAGVLVAAPRGRGGGEHLAEAAQAADLPPAITDPGGDFVVTMPYAGVDQATATTLVTKTFPQALGKLLSTTTQAPALPANPTLSEEMTAAYWVTTSAAKAAGVTTEPPNTFDGGSVSLTPDSVSVDVPSGAIPPNDVSNPVLRRVGVAWFRVGTWDVPPCDVLRLD